MQRWSPEPLEDGPEPGDGGTAAVLLQEFRSERAEGRSGSVLEQLAPEDRDAIYRLVERDVATACAAKHEQALAAQEEAQRRWLEQLASRLEAQTQARWQRLARETVDLAVTIAEKIVRRAVRIDEAAIVRALETVLYKLDAGETMTVIAHPEDAAYLAGHDELRRRLRVTAVKEDRRIERGGCRIVGGEQEWDATLASQLEALHEVVEQNLLGQLALGDEDEREGPDDAGLA